MSYILDALKKSDQDRRRGSVPGVHAQQAPTVQEPKKRKLWPYVLIVALLFNVPFLAWWLSPWLIQTLGNPFQRSDKLLAALKDGKAVLPSPDGQTPETEKTQRPTREDCMELQQSEGKSASLRQSPRPGTRPNPAGSPAESRPESAREDVSKKPSVKPAPAAEIKEAAAPAARPAKQPPASKSREEEAPIQFAALENRPQTTRVDTPKTPSVNPAPALDVQEPAAYGARPAKQPKASKNPEEQAMAKLIAEFHQNRRDPRAVQGQLSRGSRGAAARPRQTEPTNALPEEISNRSLAKPNQTQETTMPTEALVGASKQSPPQNAPAEDTQTRQAKVAKPEPGIPELRELPLPIQQEVPNMSFSMLVYSEQPGERMISINGRVMREGQEVKSGLKLDQITPNGAVFSFKGYRFRRGVL